MEDIISKLPDDILISIIARIPSLEALRTSILSKRWRNLFKSMTNISFVRRCTIKYHCDSKAIIDGVHGVLQRHSAYIRSFKFSACLSKLYTDKFEQCIHFLGELGIEQLFLEASCESWLSKFSFTFSCHLLSHMPSLKYFKLKVCYLQPNLKIPCNSLKTLKLYHVKAPPGSLECILSNCLSLSILTFQKCEFPSKLCFCGPNLQLKYLAILDCKGLEEIYFYASNLMTFDFNGFDVNFIFDYVPQLQSIYLCSSPEDMPYYCGILGKYMPRLKTLVLDNNGDPYQDGSISLGMNMFNNLKLLELDVSYLDAFDLFSLTRVLHSCPLLQEFHLAAKALYFVWPEEETHVGIQHHLTKVEISGFGGSDSEVNFALYILQSAVRLEQMFISWYSMMYFGYGEWEELDDPPYFSKTWSEIYEKIQELKHEAVSKRVQVIFQKSPHVKSKQF